jgi:hypothetical protein
MCPVSHSQDEELKDPIPVLEEYFKKDKNYKA